MKSKAPDEPKHYVSFDLTEVDDENINQELPAGFASFTVPESTLRVANAHVFKNNEKEKLLKRKAKSTSKAVKMEAKPSSSNLLVRK